MFVSASRASLARQLPLAAVAAASLIVSLLVATPAPATAATGTRVLAADLGLVDPFAVSRHALPEVDPQTTGSIEGTLADDTGHVLTSLVDVDVYRHMSGSHEYVGSTVSDSTGGFAATGLAPGSYSVFLRPRDHWQPWQWIGGSATVLGAETVTVVAGEATIRRVGMESREMVRGYVTDPFGETVDADIRVLVADDVGGDLVFFATPAAAYRAGDGHFQTEAFPRGAHIVVQVLSQNPAYLSEWVGGDSFETAKEYWAGPWLQITVGIAGTGQVEGQVTPFSNKMESYLVGAHRKLADGTWELVNAVRTEYGRYELAGLPAGEYSLTIAPSDKFMTKTIPEEGVVVTLEADRSITQDLTAVPGGILDVRLLSDQGQYITDAKVTLSRFFRDDWVTVTDWYPAGGLEFAGLAPGRYRVGVEPKPSHYLHSVAASDEVQVVEGARKSLVVPLTSGPFIHDIALSGTRRVGDLLTAEVTATPGAMLSYQWWRGDTPLASTEASYRLTLADHGQLIGVTVTASDDRGLTSPARRSQWVVVAGALQPAGVPHITGTPASGRILVIDPGTWAPGTSFRYSWFADSTLIEGATGSTLVVQPRHEAKTITAVVLGSLNGYVDTSRETAGVLIPCAGTPVVSGAAAVGYTLTAVHCRAPGVAYGYAWYADGVLVAGATKSSFVPTAPLQHKRISVRVTGTINGVRMSNATSAQSSRTIASAAPTIAGTRVVGYTLSARPGTWTSGTTFRYQWYASGIAIADATRPTLTLQAVHRDKVITVRVTGGKSGYSSLTRTSGGTSRIAQIAQPTIAGTLKVGQKLTIRPGVWTPGTTLTYRWYANGKAISGATSLSFKLTWAQAGKAMSVKVTGSKPGYGTYTQTSPSTNPVRR